MMTASPFTSHIIIHQQWRIDTKSDTSNYQDPSPVPRSIILLSLHANIMHPNQDNGGRCPVNGEDAYRTKVHYQHKLCTPNRIRRSLTNSNKHTCVHLHRSRRHRWERQDQLTAHNGLYCWKHSLCPMIAITASYLHVTWIGPVSIKGLDSPHYPTNYTALIRVQFGLFGEYLIIILWYFLNNCYKIMPQLFICDRFFLKINNPSPTVDFPVVVFM